MAFTFTPQFTDRYVFTATPTTSWDAVLYVLDTCPGSHTISACSGGADAHASSTTPEILAVSLTAGHVYTVVVDGYSSSSKGAFTLSAVRTPAPAGDTCATAQTLTAGTPVTADTTNASNNVTISSSATGCATSTTASGLDLVYTFHAPTTDRYLFTLTPPAGASPVLSVASSCVDGPLTACVGGDAPGTGGVAHVIASLTAGTDYTVIVDSTSATSGAGVYTLTADVAPPPPAGDTCATAPSLVVGTPLTVDTTLASNDVTIAATATNCAGTTAGGKDVVVSFQAPADGAYLIKLTPPANITPVLSVVATCVDGPITACIGSDDPFSSGEPAHVLLQATAGTTYTVVVDTSSAATGTFTLTADTLPAIDTCTASSPALTVGTAVTGDTTFYTNDYTPSTTSTHCTGYSETGPDVVYAFTAPVAGRFQFELTPDSSSDADVSLYALDTCPTTSAVTACLGGADEHGDGEAEAMVVTLAQGQAIYVVVDAYSGGAGAYSLLATQLPDGPAGDACGTAVALASHNSTSAAETVTGSLTNASDDVSGTCTNGSGNDIVYALTLTEQVAFTATLTADDGGAFSGGLHLNSDCAATPTNELGCVTSSQGSLTLPHLGAAAGGTYYLWVDGTSSSAADYSLHVALSAAVPAPPGDVCSSALTLTESTTTAGTLANFSNDFVPTDATCNTSGTGGPDVVYSFTPQATGPYVFTLTPDATMHGALYLLDNCPTTSDVGTCLAGDDNQFSAGSVATFRATLTAGTTYFVVADSHPGDTGSYTLTAEPVVVPANDVCSATVPVLTLNTAVVIDTTNLTNDYSPASSTAGCGASSHQSGPDAVYQFTAATAGTYIFSSTPQAAFDASIYVVGTCPGSATVASCLGGADDHGSSTSPETFSLVMTAGQLVYVIVDGYNTTSAGVTSVKVSQ